MVAFFQRIKRNRFSYLADYVDIEVLTKNIFIDKQHLNHLFERFYQIDSSRHSKAKTGGLGLSIVKSIMMLHNGEANVHNSQQGVVFRLRIKY